MLEGIYPAIPDGYVSQPIFARLVTLFCLDDAVHALKGPPQGLLVPRQHPGSIYEILWLHIAWAEYHRHPDFLLGVEIIHARSQFLGQQPFHRHQRVHHFPSPRCQIYHSLLLGHSHIDGFRIFPHLEIVFTGLRQSRARNGHMGRLALKVLKHHCQLPRPGAHIHMIVEDPCLSLDHIRVENTMVLHIFRAVRKEQYAPLIMNLHRPRLHNLAHRVTKGRLSRFPDAKAASCHQQPHNNGQKSHHGVPSFSPRKNSQGKTNKHPCMVHISTSSPFFPAEVSGQILLYEKKHT